MRSLAFSALLGSLALSANLFGQSLTEHAAAAAGATIGTAAGKPLGTALGRVFGEVNKPDPAPAKTTKPAPAKPVAVAPAAAPATAAVAAHPSAGAGTSGGDEGDTAGGGSGGSSTTASARHAARHKAILDEPQPIAAAPVVTIVAEPVVKEPSVQDVASIQVGATASQLREVLGAPESRVSIPGDDGHLLEICQYWAKGEPIGTIRLDNGHVISVQANN
jgi:hypothetical protein